MSGALNRGLIDPHCRHGYGGDRGQRGPRCRSCPNLCRWGGTSRCDRTNNTCNRPCTPRLTPQIALCVRVCGWAQPASLQVSSGPALYEIPLWETRRAGDAMNGYFGSREAKYSVWIFTSSTTRSVVVTPIEYSFSSSQSLSPSMRSIGGAPSRLASA